MHETAILFRNHFPPFSFAILPSHLLFLIKAELPSNRYWEDDATLPPKGHTWITLTHNGPAFPEPYVPHGVKLLYDGKPVDLKPEEVLPDGACCPWPALTHCYF